MGIKKVKPTSPGRRFATFADFAEITKTDAREVPHRGAARSRVAATTTAARPPATAAAAPSAPTASSTSSAPRTACRPRSHSIEYDPNRSAYIALLHYADGEKRYIIAPARLRAGMTVESGPGVDITTGNALPLPNIPVGTVIHNVELQPGRGAQLGRSAGVGIQLMAKEGDLATLRLPSGEMRQVRVTCRATVGVIGNADHQNIDIGKAGRKRHMGVRPQTRGKAMNPVDHPHGGGEGGGSLGNHPQTPWGKPTLGYRTRKKGKASDRYIVRGRRRGKRG